MTRRGAELEELKKSNKLQQEMIVETKEKNTETSKHNTTTRRLKWALVILVLITVLTNIAWVIITVKMVR